MRSSTLAESTADKAFQQSLDSASGKESLFQTDSSWSSNFPDFLKSDPNGPSVLHQAGVGELSGIASYGITIGTRLKMNKILGGKHKIDDHALVGARSIRTGLLAGGGELAGGILGYNLASQVFLDEDDSLLKKVSVKGLGTMAGGALGHMANTALSTLNGAYLGYKINNSILETRSGISKLLGGVGGILAGAGTGFVVSQVPFGQAVMNVAGFGAVDILSDRKEARENGIGGMERGKYLEGKSLFGVNLEMNDKLKMGTFVEDVLNPLEITQLQNSLGNILSRLQNSPDEDEQKEILENIQKFLPVSYSEISEVPASVEELLKDSAITVYRNRKKWEKAGKNTDLLPTPAEIIRNAHTLSLYLSTGSEPNEEEINDILDPTHLEYWGNSRVLRPKILNNEDIKFYILNKFSDAGMRILYNRLYPTVIPIPGIAEIDTTIKAEDGEKIFQQLGPANRLSILRVIQRDKEEDIKNIIIEEEKSKLTINRSYQSRLTNFSAISKFVRDLDSEESEESGTFFEKVVSNIKNDTSGSIIKILSAKEAWDQLPTSVKNSIKKLNPFKRK